MSESQESEPKQLDAAFNLYCFTKINTNVVKSPRNDFFLQQIYLSVLVFKQGVQLLLTMDSVGRAEGLALDPSGLS